MSTTPTADAAAPRLVVATHNAGKVREIARLTEGLPFRVVSLAELADHEAPEEDGATFAENAILKAAAAAMRLGGPAMADDSGLCVDASLPCSRDEECGEGEVCDLETAACRGTQACVEQGDCDKSEFCDPVTKTCRRGTPCTADIDCPGSQRCDPQLHTCG